VLAVSAYEKDRLFNLGRSVFDNYVYVFVEQVFVSAERDFTEDRIFLPRIGYEELYAVTAPFFLLYKLESGIRESSI
jgi:hypothetical protein